MIHQTYFQHETRFTHHTFEYSSYTNMLFKIFGRVINYFTFFTWVVLSKLLRELHMAVAEVLMNLKILFFIKKFRTIIHSAINYRSNFKYFNFFFRFISIFILFNSNYTWDFLCNLHMFLVLNFWKHLSQINELIVECISDGSFFLILSKNTL